MARYQRNKGIKNELEAAKLWREASFSGARRNLGQYQERSGQDLLETEPFVVQCKVGSRTNVWEALREAEAAVEEGSVPLAMVRKDRGEWVVVIRWCDFGTTLSQGL